MYRNSRFFLIAFIAILTLGILLGGPDRSDESAKEPVLSDFDPASINKIRFVKADQTATLEREANGWVVVERHGYAADVRKVVRFLKDLRTAKLLEAKTARVENHEALGVAGGIMVSLDEGEVFHLGSSASGRTGRYLRFASEDQVWLQSAVLPDVSARPQYWLDKTLFDVDGERITRLEIEHEGERLIVEQAEPGSIEAVGIAVDELRFPDSADSLVTMLEDLSFVDVTLPDTVDFSAASTVMVELVDGSSFQLILAEQDGKYWLTLANVVTTDVDSMPFDKVARWAFEISRLNYDNMTRTKQSLAKTDETADGL